MQRGDNGRIGPAPQKTIVRAVVSTDNLHGCLDDVSVSERPSNCANVLVEIALNGATDSPSLVVNFRLK
jgi:hypothetical protein